MGGPKIEIDSNDLCVMAVFTVDRARPESPKEVFTRSFLSDEGRALLRGVETGRGEMPIEKPRRSLREIKADIDKLWAEMEKALEEDGG